MKRDKEELKLAWQREEEKIDIWREKLEEQEKEKRRVSDWGKNMKNIVFIALFVQWFPEYSLFLIVLIDLLLFY